MSQDLLRLRHGDAVNSPAHYTQDGPIHATCQHPIECIDVAQTLGFNLGNVVKYCWRAGKKDPAKTVEDLEKAARYLQFEIERLRGLP